MKKNILNLNASLLASSVGLIASLLATTRASAQTGAGTNTTWNTPLIISNGSTQEIYAETFYIGPDAVLNLDGGDLLIYSKYIWIAPAAQISGTGRMIIANPDDNPQYVDMSGVTTVDGNNGLPLAVAILHQNPNNIILDDIPDPGFNTTNPPGPLAAALQLGSAFFFEAPGGDVLLNDNDLILTTDGILSNYFYDRCVITGNSIAGHLVKMNAGNSSFTTFPVGIAEGEYTPVSIQGNADYHVSITDYAGSGITISGPQEGMDRAWHIYGGAADQIYLQHNIATDGTLYNDAAAFITRYLGGGNWSTAAASDYLIDGFHYNAGAIPQGIPLSAAADGAWLSKTSEELTPLPINLLRFQARKEGRVVTLEWTTAAEQHCSGFAIERSIDGSNWTQIGIVNSASESGNSNTRSDYSFIDDKPLNGRDFYRLRQMDFEGKYTFSKLVSILFDQADRVTIYPNPVTKYIHINGIQYGASIALYDVSGRLLQQQQAIKDKVDIDMENLNSGIYIINITATDGSTTQYKVVKQP